MLRRFLIIAVAGALLAACGSDQGTGTSPNTRPTAQHNEADLTFTRGMIPHHQQALDMAELVKRRTQRPELLTLADAIIEDQGRELGLMQSWLEAWGEGSDDGGRGHGSGHGEPPGMMPQAQMNELTRLQATEFDLAFTRMMAEHHRGAIEMAEAELRDGANADAKKLAEQIRTAQRKEIHVLTKWQQQWTTAS